MKFSKCHTCIFLSVLCLYSACQPAAQRPRVESTGDYNVRVFRDGQEVKDFESRLVHRVEISSKQLGRFLASNGELRELPFALRVEPDSQGKVRGLRVLDPKQSGGTALLGLADQDVVTAVGTRHLRKKTDFAFLFQALKSDKTASLTLERRGEPHKILFYLDSPVTPKPVSNVR